ncbi:hypothetical protein EOA36_30035 [Mesorhizobium sp. M8A.F.Ca.ET.021.01.1.1]|nr:hypothetical protein EOA36_30035 [Mesorhizobium sp. M8A.F.Ca.ET.021.01.1.1]
MCKMNRSNRLPKFRIAHAEKQNWRCFYCGFPMWNGDPSRPSDARQLSVRLLSRFLCTAEHLSPKMDGGKDRPENLVAACKFCNQTRHRMRNVLSPAAYQQHVRKRILARKWHPIEYHRLLDDPY